MAKVQFGWMLPGVNAEQEQAAYLSTLRQGLDIIAGHFDSVWYPDHVQFGERPVLEGWTLLTYAAALRPELRYGHIVLCQLFRNPAVLAKMAATLQYLSQGKFILGLGAGWHEEETKAYNLPFPPAGQRVDELGEVIQIIKALWTEDNVTFEGEHHRVTNAYCVPRPDPVPPIMVAAFQPRMLRLTARYADWWNIGADSVEKARWAAEQLEEACNAVGRDPKTIQRTLMTVSYCGHDEQKLKKLTDAHKGPFGTGFVGTPEQVAEQMRPYVDLGYNYFMISAGGIPDFTSLELLAHEVLPLLNK
ncbi:LLM class flavin-dependent oxidoreductase [Ktedonobacteria bacterium brp13]|nr:LLM class flavin-dependent oxidoreductase [Ktedonobacteria bacterium brp13]